MVIINQHLIPSLKVLYIIIMLRATDANFYFALEM